MKNGASILPFQMDESIWMALKEDITSEDISTNAIIREKKQAKVDLIAKESGVLAGLSVFTRVFQLLDGMVRFETQLSDGDEVKPGQLIGVLTGEVHALLSGERTALNYLQRMSGIATMTRDFVTELKGSHTRLLDTRKTTPTLRVFEKYAVSIGGGCQHRYNLSDGILLKDNHIAAAGGVREAIAMARAYAPFLRKIEVEVETLEMVQEAVDAGADIIMLDNMDIPMMKEAVRIIAGRALTECSGNVTKQRLQELKEIGIDYVSSGALTHSAKILDLSLKHLRLIDESYSSEN